MKEKSLQQFQLELKTAFTEFEPGRAASLQPFRLALFDRLDSTMAAARKLPPGRPLIETSIAAWPEVDAIKGVTVAVALEQTAGRGRFDRVWVSPRGSGVYLTAALETSAPIAKLPSLSLVCGVAVCEAVNSLGSPGRLKWPNDVLVKTAAGHKKLAGLLLETVPSQSATLVLVGIGLNVEQTVGAAAAGGISLAETSAGQIGYSQTVLALVRSLAVELERFFQSGPADHLKRWRESSVTIGAEISFTYGQNLRRGIARDIDQSGALIVESQGEVLKLVSGEVSISDAACI